MPLGVEKRMQKVWGQLVVCRLSNEDVLLRPRVVAMVLMSSRVWLFWDFQSRINIKDRSGNAGRLLCHAPNDLHWPNWYTIGLWDAL
jgi:hypothetical protein